jgi:carotenoid 1,2-hydratase
MLGSVFSPWYAAARRRGPTDPLRHCAVNVALYGAGSRTWALTERGRDAVERTSDRLRIGASHLTLARDGALEVHFDERTAPLPGSLRGKVRLEASGIFAEPQVLDASGAHTWWPVAPRTRAHVNVSSHGVSFEGSAYFDANAGGEPLERRLARWSWARVDRGNGTVITYDVTDRAGNGDTRTLAFDRDNRRVDAPRLLPCALGRGAWGVARPGRADHSQGLRALRTLEDSPFYTRTEIEACVGGRLGRGVHESLDLERFENPWVQRMLPFRMRDERR